MNVVTAIWGNKYDESYVTALKNQIPGLIVLREYDGLYQPSNFREWWCKIEVFRPENRHLRPCLFVDLDTFVFDLDPVLALDTTGLWLIKQFYQPEKSESGLFIAPEGGISDLIWHKAQQLNLPTTYSGDGQFLATFEHRRITDEVDGILSYKVDQLYEDRKNASIVCFHGKPKPHECDGWARQHFERLAKSDE